MKTLADWLREAEGAAGPSHALTQAESLAGEDAFALQELVDWLLAHRPGDRDRLRRVVDRCAHAGLSALEVRSVLRAARALSGAFGERPRAEALIRDLGARLTQTEGQGWRWGGLIKGTARIFGDGRLVSELVQCATAQTHAPRDRASLAMDLTHLGRASLALDLLDGLQPADPHDAWNVANAWVELGHRDRAEATLRRALETAGGRACATLVKALAGHDMHAGVQHALELASTRLETYADALDIAEAVHEAEQGPEAVHAWLQRAVSLAGSAAEKGAVASAFLTLLHDVASAERIAPLGERPDALRRPRRSLLGLEVHADACALLDHLRARITPVQLQRIAKADYGMAYERHLAALEHIATTGRVMAQLPWEPLEVLQLTRWAEGVDVDHVARAFACAVLLLGDPDGHVSTWAPLVESAIALGEPLLGVTEAFAVWEVTCLSEFDTETRVATLWALALCAASRAGVDPRLSTIAELLWDTDDDCIVAGNGSSILDYTVNAELWRHLTQEVLVPRRGVKAIADILDALGWP